MNITFNRRPRRGRYPVSYRKAGCFGSVIGLVFVAVGVFIAYNAFYFLPGSVSTTGTIVHCTDDSNGDCQPTVRFTTKAGQKITFDSSASASYWNEGSTVTVQYHPATPNDARIDMGNWWWVICLGMGFLVLVLSLRMFILGLINPSLYTWASRG